MKLFFRACVFVAGLVLSGVACAVGMGGINVSSALGEPLDAEIELAGMVTKANSDGSLTARIASPDVFKGAGLEYPYALPKLKFQIATRSNGESYLRISTQSPVNDPFVTLLVELNWSSGRLLREYTFLLDPPGFRPEQPPETSVKPLAPSAAASSQAYSEPVKTEAAPTIVIAPVRPSAEAGKGSVSSGRTSSGTIVVKRGDTLSKIANQVKSPDISLERMLVALYRNNSDEFDGKNMNRLRVGKILRLPDHSDIEKVTQADAAEMIHVQAADWNAYRQKLAAANVTARETASRQEISGKISAKVADKTPSVKGSDKEVVRLSKGESPGDKTVPGGSQARGNAVQEELIAKSNQLKDSNNRIAMLEKNITDMQHLLDLKSQTMTPSKQAAAKAAPLPAPTPSAEVKPVESPAKVAPSQPAATQGAANETQQVKPAVQPKPAAAVHTPPPSLMDEVLDEPLYIGGIAVVLLALGGGLMVVRRNKRRSKTWGEAEINISEPVAHSVVASETPQPGPATQIVPDEEVDPISEADLFLNFGRDTQAEEILKYALEKDPANLNILLKLLSIYANRKDAKTFFAMAQQVRESGDADAWEQAARMGHQLEPGNPAYITDAGAESATGHIEPEPVPVPVPQKQTTQGLDFELNFGEQNSIVAAGTEMPDKASISDLSALDFDLGADFPGIGSPDIAETDNQTAKFSTGSFKSAQLDTKQNGVIDLTLDSLSFHGGEAGTAATGAATGAEVDDFIDVSSKSMSLPVFGGMAPVQPDSAGEAEAPMPDEFIDVSSKSMSLPSWGAGLEIPTAGSAPKQVTDMHQTDELIDITSASLPRLAMVSGKPATGSMAEPAQNDDSIFHGIDLNLNDQTTGEAVVADQPRDAHWNEIATKIDLAKAYQEMGEVAGAREILKEVIDEGDEQQRATAREMLEHLAS